MLRSPRIHTWVAALLATISLIATIGSALAGTTGTLRGRVVDRATHAPLVGARISAVSPSQSATATTGAQGDFVFIALAPDTYTISVEAPGFEAQSLQGVTIVADQAQTVGIDVSKTLRTIGRTTARAGASGLVKAGTTTDVYSVSPAQQTASATLGGVGSIDQAYAGLAALPGVSYDLGQVGWGQEITIRGGAQSDVAYELDGIPVQRDSDQFSTTTLSTLGQQELQVYTGGAPASADATGLSGYVNQVIRTGTTPGFVDGTLGLGGPSFYHKVALEAGGQTASRNFSYYVGASGSDESFRFIDQHDGAGDPRFAYPIAVTTSAAGNGGGTNGAGTIYDGSGSAIFAPGMTGQQTYSQDRENIANFHLALPHKRSGIKDDLQLLLLESEYVAQVNSSPNDLGGLATVTNAIGTPPIFLDNYVYGGALMAPLNGTETVRPTQFPGSQPHQFFGQALPADSRDGNSNNVGIVKLQYQKNFDERSYLRVFGYSNYSNWFFTGPSSDNSNYGSVPADYEVHEHGYGLNLRYTNQLSTQHLLTLTGSYQTQKLLTLNNAANEGVVASNYVDAAGNCYGAAGFYASCFTPTANGGGYNAVSQYGSAPGALVPCALDVAGQCAGTDGTPAVQNGARWKATSSGYNGQIDTVRPYFTAYSISDEFRPSARVTLSAGLRFENYLYRLDDLASGYPARAFWFDAYNREQCFAAGQPAVTLRGAPDPLTGLFPACAVGGSPGLTNALPHTTQFGELQPRLGATFSLDPDTVLRASYGRYAEQFGSSFQEYNTVQQDLPSFIGQFLPFGFTTPYHPLVPSVANSYDASLEHRFRGTDLAFKLSPFYRSTANELQGTPIGAQGVYANLNTGRTRAYGVEFALDKGNFDRNGLAFVLAYTFTASRTRFDDITPGTNYIDTLNALIQHYNSYTSACATPNARLCGTDGAANAQATFAGTAADRTAIPNPYYAVAPQQLYDRGGEYATYTNLPAGYNADVGRITPHVATLVLNYRHGPFAFTPTLSFSAGRTYGAPLVWPGYDPASCAALSTAGTADTTTCTGSLFIPDTYTGRFDLLGAFVQPARLTLNLGTSFDLSKRVKLRVQATGLIDHCYQRGYAWDDRNICEYSSLPSNALAPVGNFVPLASAPVQLRYPYSYYTTFNTAGFIGSKAPFNLFTTLDVKL